MELQALGHGSGLCSSPSGPARSPGRDVNIHSRSFCQSGLYGNCGAVPGISQQLFRSDWLGKKKKKSSPSPSTGQIWRLTSSPGGSRRIAELRERLSCFVCERVENSQQGIGQAEESFSVTALPGHRGAKSGEQHRSHRKHLGSRWVLKPFNVIIHRGRSALNSVFA